MRKAVECARDKARTQEREEGVRVAGDLRRSKHERAAVMGPDHPSRLAGSPLGPACAGSARWNGCTDE